MANPIKIDPLGFREYDARWLYPQNINQEGVKLVGKGFGTQGRGLRNKDLMEALDILKQAQWGRHESLQDIPARTPGTQEVKAIKMRSLMPSAMSMPISYSSTTKSTTCLTSQGKG